MYTRPSKLGLEQAAEPGAARRVRAGFERLEPRAGKLASAALREPGAIAGPWLPDQWTRLSPLSAGIVRVVKRVLWRRLLRRTRCATEPYR
jgi:hypothetical protein